MSLSQTAATKSGVIVSNICRVAYGEIGTIVASPDGTTTKQVTSVFDSATKAKLEDLLDLGILTLESDRYHTAQSEFTLTGNTNLLAPIRQCSRFIRNEHQGQQK